MARLACLCPLSAGCALPLIFLATEHLHDTKNLVIASDARNGIPLPRPQCRGCVSTIWTVFRGLAALFVLLHHAHAELDYRYAAEGLKPWLSATKVLSWGHFSVSVFIILLRATVSCFPWREAAPGELRGGFADYIWRRARSDPAPLLCGARDIALDHLALPGLRYAYGHDWDVPLKAFTPGILLSHGLLIHNFSPDWIDRIDLPMWERGQGGGRFYFSFRRSCFPFGAAGTSDRSSLSASFWDGCRAGWDGAASTRPASGLSASSRKAWPPRVINFSTDPQAVRLRTVQMGMDFGLLLGRGPGRRSLPLQTRPREGISLVDGLLRRIGRRLHDRGLHEADD